MPDSARFQALETALSGLKKRFGDTAVMRLGDATQMEVDAIPTTANSARLIYVDQIDENQFNVYITNGNHSETENEFTFIVTAR